MKKKDLSGNKGYAFVMYRTKDLAAKAMDKLSAAEFKVINITPSVSFFSSHLLFAQFSMQILNLNIAKYT